MNYKNKTKLIATMGPSLDKLLKINFNATDPSMQINLNGYSELINSGIDVFRFNMSHDTFENHKIRFDYLRKCDQLVNKKTAILIDTKGPEIRVQKIQNTNFNNNVILKNDLVTIVCNDINYIGNKQKFSVSDKTNKYHLSNDVTINDLIYIDDGKLILKVIEIDTINKEIKAISLTDNYEIKSNKRVNLYNKKYSLPFLNDYDIKTIKLSVEWDADYLALSFISNIQEINEVKKIIYQTNKNSKIKLIAKIETFEALENIEQIIKNCDGVMVARGDLALEIGWEKTPYYQEQIVNLCNKYNKISIIATQMLDSLETKFIPTRAEVIDCYYAVKLNVDSTMLSGETASGNDPLNAIKVMKKICEFSFKNNSFKIKTSFKNKILIFLIKILIKKYENIILSNFNENEIRIITKFIKNKNFFLLNDANNINRKNILFSNLEIIENKATHQLIIDKNKIKFLMFFW